MRSAAVLLGFLMTMVPAWAQAQQPDQALQLLDTVAKRYSEARSVHLEALVVAQTRSDLYLSTQSSFFSVYEASGGRLHYEGTSWAGHGSMVSDGTSEWVVHASFGQFTRRPAGTYFKQRILSQGDDARIFEARDLRIELNSLASNLKSAHLLADETVTVGDRAVRCLRVQWGTKDQIRTYGNGEFTETVWIDPAGPTVIKEETRTKRVLGLGNLTPAHGTLLNSVYTTLYTTVEIGVEPPAEVFQFKPAQDVAQVDAFPDPFPKAKNVPTATSAMRPLPQMEGKPAPEIVLSAVGKTASLKQYRGRPLLIDLWATWCGPCMMELPLLGRIREALRNTDFAMIGIDEDKKTEDAVALLKRRGYDWEDFHFNKDVVASLPTPGIPLLALIDASGEIVYYKDGYDAEGLIAAIAKLGPAYAAVTSAR